MKKPAADPETCASCRFFLLSEPKDEAGYCRRFPPRIVVINDEADSAQPVTLHDEWCGEYKRLTN